MLCVIAKTLCVVVMILGCRCVECKDNSPSMAEIKRKYEKYLKIIGGGCDKTRD